MSLTINSSVAPVRDALWSRCVSALRSSGVRVTRSRLAVMRCLSASPRTLSARAIHQHLSRHNPGQSVDLATVYRTLQILVSMGLAHQVGPSSEYMLCHHIGCDYEHHIITRCEACGAAQEIDLPPSYLASVLTHLSREYRFEPREHYLQLSGLCRQCRLPARWAHARTRGH